MYCAMRRPAAAWQSFEQFVGKRDTPSLVLCDGFVPMPGSFEPSMLHRTRHARLGAQTVADRGVRHDVCADDIEQVRATQLLLEAAAIALAGPRLSAEQIDLARAANEALRGNHEGVPSAVAARRFHQALLAACPNHRMLELIGSAGRCGDPDRGHPADPDAVERARADHGVILSMITSGASQRDLEHALRQHALTSTLCSMGG